VALEINSRTDNIRRMIKGLTKFTPSDQFEDKCWLKVSKTNDPDLTIGYCMKEDKYETNFEEQDKYKEYHKMKQPKGDIGKWTCKSVNGLFMECQKWVIDTGIKSWKYKVIGEMGYTIKQYPKIKTVITRLHTEGLIPTSLALKYKPMMEELWKDLWEQPDLEDMISYEGFE